MTAFAMFRLPLADEYTLMEQTEGEPDTLLSYAELSGRSGFVMAPFAPGAGCPVILLHPDRIRSASVSTLSAAGPADLALRVVEKGRDTYAVDYANYHAQLEDGSFSKLVLARQSKLEASADIRPEALFARACRLYPRMFVALVSTPRSGMWLTATPEILVEGCQSQWRTMALAGTMKLSDTQMAFDTPPSGTRRSDSHGIEWSMKNRREQRYVATYITECLEHFTSSFHEEGPYTTRAGNLVHLRSDFTFTLSDSGHIGDLLEALHPTPAVCGLPKAPACRFILDNEAAPRSYYSGFMGPLQPGADTHLFVTLRCMQIAGRRYTLYAGGGLLRDSDEEHEWQETEAKMETMKRTLTEPSASFTDTPSTYSHVQQ